MRRETHDHRSTRSHPATRCERATLIYGESSLRPPAHISESVTSAYLFTREWVHTRREVDEYKVMRWPNQKQYAARINSDFLMFYKLE